MRELDSPRTVPDRDAYFVLDDFPDIQWRRPNDLVLSTLGKTLSLVLTDDGKVSAEIDPLDSLESVGAYVGAFWFHRALTLETVRPKYRAPVSDWQEYGGDVIEELHEHGFETAHAVQWWQGLMQKYAERLGATKTVREEATDTVDFGAPPTESTTSPG